MVLVSAWLLVLTALSLEGWCFDWPARMLGPFQQMPLKSGPALLRLCGRGRMARRMGQSRFKVTVKAAFSFEGGDRGGQRYGNI